MESSSVTSSGSSLHPRASSGATASTSRAVAYTVQPLRASRSAVAHPIPDEQPVMSTALEVHPDPFSDIDVLQSCACTERWLPKIMPLRVPPAPDERRRRREVDAVEEQYGDEEEGEQNGAFVVRVD